MPRSRWPTQNKLNGIFGGFLSHNALSGLFFFSLQVFCLYIMVCDFCVFMGFVCGSVCVSASVCVSYALSLAPFFCLLLSYSVFLCFIAYFVLRERQGIDVWEWEDGKIWDDLVRGGEP